jgi:hypothetical protein
LPGNENLFPSEVMGKDGKTQSSTKREKRKPKDSPAQVEQESRSEALLLPLEPAVDVLMESQKPDVTVEPVPSKTKVFDEFNIINWECFDGLEPRDQIKRFWYAIKGFDTRLTKDEDQQYLYLQVKHWLAEKTTRL